MMSRKNRENKYSKLSVSRGAVRSSGSVIKDHRLAVELSPDHVINVDVSFLASRPQMQRAFLEFIRILGDSVVGVTKQNLISILRGFVMFLDEYEDKNGVAYRETSDIDGSILLNYRIWLETRDSFRIREDAPNIEGDAQQSVSSNKLSNLTVDITYRSLTALLKKVRSYHPEWFPRLPSVIPRLGKSNRSWKPVDDVLGVADLTRILAAAKCEVDRTVEQYDRIQKILKETEDQPILPKGGSIPTNYWKTLENAVHYIIRESDFITPHPSNLRRVLLKHHKTSPTEILSMYIPVGESALLPFALQLYILTALNVSSLVTLTRDCIQDFPLPQYKKLVYDKPRSGSGRAKSQLIPAHGAKSAERGTESQLEIIKFLIKWTEPLAQNAPEHLKNYLFLFRADRGVTKGSRIRLISKYSPFEVAMPAFIARYRESHQLPDFNPNDLRPAVATYIYFKTRDIFRVQRFLGHRSIRTTIRYIRGRIINAEHDKSMAGAIEEIIRRVLPEQSTHLDSAEEQGPQLPVSAIIIEGKLDDIIDGTKTIDSLSPADAAQLQESGVITLASRCRQPFKPPSYLNVPPGQLCTKIFKCLTCPNAVVLEEDLPYVLLRIKQIWEERKVMSEDGWHVLYADTWLALNQVARLFSKEARNRATEIMKAELTLSAEESNEN